MLSELPFSLYWEDETKLVSFVPDRSFKPGSPKIFCPGTKCRLDRVNLIFSLWRSLIALADTHYIFHTLTHTHIHLHSHKHVTDTHKQTFSCFYTHIHTHTYHVRAMVPSRVTAQAETAKVELSQYLFTEREKIITTTCRYGTSIYMKIKTITGRLFLSDET